MVRACAAGLSGAVYANAGFTNPDQKTTGFGCFCDSGMCNDRTWLERQARDEADWDLQDRTVGLKRHNAAILDFDACVFQEQERLSVPDGGRAGLDLHA